MTGPGGRPAMSEVFAHVHLTPAVLELLKNLDALTGRLELAAESFEDIVVDPDDPPTEGPRSD